MTELEMLAMELLTVLCAGKPPTYPDVDPGQECKVGYYLTFDRYKELATHVQRIVLESQVEELRRIKHYKNLRMNELAHDYVVQRIAELKQQLEEKK